MSTGPVRGQSISKGPILLVSPRSSSDISRTPSESVSPPPGYVIGLLLLLHARRQRRSALPFCGCPSWAKQSIFECIEDVSHRSKTPTLIMSVVPTCLLRATTLTWKHASVWDTEGRSKADVCDRGYLMKYRGTNGSPSVLPLLASLEPATKDEGIQACVGSDHSDAASKKRSTRKKQSTSLSSSPLMSSVERKQHSSLFMVL